MLLPAFDYAHESGLLKKQPLLKAFTSHKTLVDIIEKDTCKNSRNRMRSHLENILPDYLNKVY